MRSESLSHDGEQPWHEQFCQTHRHGQSAFSLVSMKELCTTGDTSLLLTAGPATTTMPTPRLTQRYQLSPAIRLSLCSHCRSWQS